MAQDTGGNMKPTDRRSFLKIAGSSLGIGVLYSAYPAAASAGEAGNLFAELGKATGEKLTPFSFLQLSDAHVGFNGPPDPLGTKAFERAVDMINALDPQPDLILFTGDLTHDSEDAAEHARRFGKFVEISDRLRVKQRFFVPGEHDAALDGGTAQHHAARSLIFSFPDPSAPEKKPLPFDAAAPFRGLGIRRIEDRAPRQPLAIDDVELTLREISGSAGVAQMLKQGELL